MIIALDNVYDKIVPGGWILLEDAKRNVPLVSENPALSDWRNGRNRAARRQR